MDNEPEVIREEMAHTRASLADKIETLEDKVVGTVQDATSAVSDTVENVREAVQETVTSVKDTVSDTVEGVKESLDLHRQVDRHPWLMVGAATALGYVGGCLLGRSAGAERTNSRYRRLPPEGTDGPQDQRAAAASWVAEERRTAAQALATPSHHWTSLFSPELAKVKGMAVGYLLGAVRDTISEALPHDMRSQVHETIDSITQKLGGQPVHGPVLEGATERRHDGEEKSASGSYTDVPGRW